MITTPVIYTEGTQNIVDAYGARATTDMNADYWNEDEVSVVRAEIKLHYEREQKFRCCYCQSQLLTTHGRVWDGEHIVSRSSHPQFLFVPKNLAVACIDCNTAKGDQQTLANKQRKTYPTRSEDFLIVHPHFDDYDTHIAIYLGRIYTPKTKKGEKTIGTCRLLRFAYEFVGWDSGLSDNAQLMTSIAGLLSLDDPAQQRIKMTEIMLMTQLQISRSLLPTTP